MPNIILRLATIDDLELLQYWDTQPHVIACDPDEDWGWETDLKAQYPWQSQMIAELNGRPLGFIQILDPFRDTDQYWGEVEDNLRCIDIWIGEASDLNKGYGTIMMKLALDQCFENPKVEKVLIDPLKTNTSAHRFYQRLGFEFIEERTFGNDQCLVFELTRQKYLGE